MKRTTRWIIYLSLLGCGAAAHASDIIQPVNITQTSACNGMVVQPVCVPGGSLTLSTFTATTAVCFADATCQNTAAVSAADAAYTDKNNNFSTTQTFASSVTVGGDLLIGNAQSTSVLNFNNTNATLLGYNSSRLDLQINGSSQLINVSGQFIVNNGTVMEIGNAAAEASGAQIDMESTTLGLLPPRMTTTQKNAISSPSEGLVVYDTSLHALCVYNGSAWKTITAS